MRAWCDVGYKLSLKHLVALPAFRCMCICVLVQVATDIILSSVYCGHAHPPHKAVVAEEWLRYASILILSFFVLEWIVEVRPVT